MPNVVNRLSSHRKAIMAVLPLGLAHRHRGNPITAFHMERLYASPVLLSGLPALVLTAQEVSVLHHHHKTHLERLQRLHQATPECVVMFLAGSLPLTATLHLRMFGLLGMIARLGENNILHKYGRSVLLNYSIGGRSWFTQIRILSQQYILPDPLLILQSPPTSLQWKKMTRLKVLDFWQTKYRGQADLLSSLQYFRPCVMSLSSPHPIWTSANSPFEVHKTVVTARMLSGRYRVEMLCRHWSRSNREGLCRLPGCVGCEG